MTIHFRAVTPQPTTLNADARTVEAIVSTGADTARPGFTERLDLRGADLSRLVGGPVLDAHRSSSTRDQLGVIEAAELRAEGLWVRIRFRSNDAAKAVLSDIGDGTQRGLSIGYTVAEWKDTRDGDRRIRTATRWTPLEVSIVPVPADPGAHFRHGGNQMETQEQTAERTAETQRETRAQANAEIRTIAETAGLARSWADAQIDAEATPDAARAAAFIAMQTRSRETATRTTRVAIGTDNTDPALIVERAGEALYARAHPSHKLSDEARPFTYNPAKGVRALKTPEHRKKEHLPWPDWAVEKFRAEAAELPRLIFEIGVGSVQRPGDWVGFRWGDYDGDSLTLRQNKTDKPLVLPCTDHLKAALDRAKARFGAVPIAARPILITRDGNPISYRYMADLMMKERRRLGLEAYDLHALRYRGVQELAWQGCDDDEIAAYSGHATKEMIAKYAGEARQIMRARQARDKRQ